MRHYDFGAGKWVFIDWMGIDPGYGTAWGGKIGAGWCVPEGIALKAHTVMAEPEPVLRAEYPWENWQVGAYATFLYDEGRYRCWYEPYYMQDGILAQREIAYAESDDGICWRKPMLGLTTFNGSRENNLVDLGTRGWAHGQSVMKDPIAPPEARYKMVSCGCDPERALATAVSPDGLHWSWVDPVLTGNNSDTQNILHYNEATARYVLYTRQSDGVMQRRGVNRSESPVFGAFPPSVPVIESSLLDPPDRDTYTNAYSQWPGAAMAHVMRPAIYRHTPDTVEVHLAVSRDEMQWHWPLREEPWVLLPGRRREDMLTCYSCAGIIPTGPGEWSTFVSVKRQGHNHPENGYGTPLPDEGFLRVPMREDGFVSLAAEGHGQCWTIPFTLTSSEIRLNVRTRYSGSLRCALLAAGAGETGEAVVEGQPIPGFTLDDCLPIQVDDVDIPLSWKGGSLEALRGQTVRLQFELFKVDLFAIKF